MDIYFLKPTLKKFLLGKIPTSNKKYSVDLTKWSGKKIQEFFFSTNFKKEAVPFSQSELDYLVSKKILYLIEEEGNYLLTYKGLTVLEYNMGYRAEFDDYLNDLNSSFFEKNLKSKYEPLIPKHKIILLTVIGLNAFSPDSSLWVDESNKYEFIRSADFAIEMLKIQNPNEVNELTEIWNSRVIGEDPILHTLRNTLAEIPKKTGNIFKTTSGKKHGIYVEIMNEDGSVNEHKVLFLLNKIFDKKPLDMNQKENLIETLSNIETGYFSLIQSNGKLDRIKTKMEIRDIILEKL